MSADTLPLLQMEILWPALVAGLLVLASHVPLGAEVLKRGIIFMDLAIAQFAGLGLLAVHALPLESMAPTASAGWLSQGAAIGAALLGALLLRWSELRLPQRQEAVIGVAFIVASCLAMLLLANDPHGSEHMQTLLIGQILWVNWQSLWPLAASSSGVLLLWLLLKKTRHAGLAFYLLFAVMVTASVQVVGVYLVFASLIIPPLASGGRLWPAWVLGALAYAGGLLASAWFDLPAGAAIVIVLALLGLPVMLMSAAAQQRRREQLVGQRQQGDGDDPGQHG